MKNMTIPSIASSSAKWGAVSAVAFIALGLARKSHFMKDHEHLISMTTGALAGHKLGATLGTLIAGPGGAMLGMTLGCVVGCMSGHKKKH